MLPERDHIVLSNVVRRKGRWQSQAEPARCTQAGVSPAACHLSWSELFLQQSAKRPGSNDVQTPLALNCPLVVKHGIPVVPTLGLNQRISERKKSLFINVKTHNALGPHLINLQPLMSTAPRLV